MWIAMSEAYRLEKEKYRLKDCCEDCSYFNEEKSSCAMLYPTEPHVKQTFLKAKDGDRIYFCKMFEAK